MLIMQGLHGGKNVDKHVQESDRLEPISSFVHDFQDCSAKVSHNQILIVKWGIHCNAEHFIYFDLSEPEIVLVTPQPFEDYIATLPSGLGLDETMSLSSADIVSLCFRPYDGADYLTTD